MKSLIAILLVFGSSWFSRGYDDIITRHKHFGYFGIIVGTVLNIIGLVLLYRMKER
jgi:hypothetical protein